MENSGAREAVAGEVEVRRIRPSENSEIIGSAGPLSVALLLLLLAVELCQARKSAPSAAFGA